MIPADTIAIRLYSASGPVVCYSVCGRIIESNAPIDLLSAFEQDRSDTPIQASTIEKSEHDESMRNIDSRLIFEGQSWLAGKDRPISCSMQTDYLIDVPDVARFQITRNPVGIEQLSERNPGITQETFEEILLGPPLMLTLASLQLFALHASAVKVNNKAVLFVGKSGFGKSTLARWLDELTPLTRLSDDICVLEAVDAGYRLLPDFLQMKLACHQQHVNANSIELAAIILLNRDNKSNVSLTKMDTLASIKTLVNHSVAAQLFDKALAQRHLEFMSHLSQALPTYTLNYPDGQQCIPTIAKILAKQLN